MRKFRRSSIRETNGSFDSVTHVGTLLVFIRSKLSFFRSFIRGHFLPDSR